MDKAPSCSICDFFHLKPRKENADTHPVYLCVEKKLAYCTIHITDHLQRKIHGKHKWVRWEIVGDSP